MSSLDLPIKTPLASIFLFRFISLTLLTTSYSLLLPDSPYCFKDGVTARQIVFSVLYKSATTKLVVNGLRLRSTHSTEA